MMEQRVRWLDEECCNCGKQINSWDKRVSQALKYKNMYCESCIAEIYDMDEAELRRRMEHYFDIRPCLGV